ncbi:MAG: LapA family protein [Snodgrassella sp.]|nr:LapA family protein [Snodgrassella sp.]
MKIVYTLIKLAVLIALLLLAVSNTQTITFSYLPGQSVDLSLIVVLLIFFIVGTIFGVFATFGRLLRLRSQVNTLQDQVKKQQENNTQLQQQMNFLQSASQPALSDTMHPTQRSRES